MENLEQRKTDLKARIAALREELRPHEQRAENLRERIAHLESDLRGVYDQLREIEEKVRPKVPGVRVDWVTCQ